MQIPSAELRNKGIAVWLYNVGPDGEPITKSDGQPALEQVVVRFTNNDVADIEEKWGSLQNWMDELEAKPVKSVRDTLAIALKRDPAEVGNALVEGQLQIYGNVIGAALSRWQGATDEQVKKVLSEGEKASAEQDEILAKAFEETENTSTGQDTSPSGLSLVETPTNSGD